MNKKYIIELEHEDDDLTCYECPFFHYQQMTQGKKLAWCSLNSAARQTGDSVAITIYDLLQDCKLKLWNE